MRALRMALTVAAMLTGGAIWAAAPDRSLRPELRPNADAGIAPAATIRPRLRPDQATVTRIAGVAVSTPVPPHPVVPPAVRPPSAQDLALPEGAGNTGPALSLRPELRPPALITRVMSQRRARAKGAVCGDPDLQGDVVGTVPGRIRGCGIKDAVRLRSVSGVTLSQSALIDCPTAKALKTWVDKGMKPALRSRGKVTQMRVAAHYACRTRNNQRGARISEHGKGRAIDISGFTMADGQVITVLTGWNARGTRRPLRRMHKAACGPFGTVLGPDSDRFHRDHFHFDTARYRSGPYCR